MTAASLIADSWVPACMDADEVTAYRAGVIGGCKDCTTAYADDRRAEGRCNGVPGELLAGVVPDEEETVEPVAIGKRMPVALVLPCSTCAHAPVCRIAPSLEGLGRVPVALPSLDDALSFEFVGKVTCAYYVKGKGQPKADQPSPPAGRKLNLSPEERERRRNQALANVEAQRQRREAASA